MTISDTIANITKDMVRQAERLTLYNKVNAIFNRKGLSLPDKTYIWICEAYDKSIHVEISPESDSEEKDLSPLAHTIARKFHAKFKKSRNYDNESLVYRADVMIENQNFHFSIQGVVPKKCHVEEKVIELTPEEIEEARKNALANIRTTRTERTIVCR